MPYQIHILRRQSSWDRDIYIFDIDRTNLITEIINNYHNGKKFLASGTTIDPFDISNIEIIETTEDSSHFSNNANAHVTADKSSNVAVIPPIPFEYYLFQETSRHGKNVTNQFIKHPPKEGKKITGKNKLIWKKIIPGGLVGAIIVLLLAQFIVIPYNQIPDYSIIKNYDFLKKSFPDEIDFSYESESNTYVSTIVLYLSQVGESRSKLFIKFLPTTDLYNRVYGDITFNKFSESYIWGFNKDVTSFRFQLKENPELQNFTIHIECGLLYERLPWPIIKSNVTWCKYQKIGEHQYKWTGDGLSN